MTITGAFLICHVWLTGQIAPTAEALGFERTLAPYHPGVYKALAFVEEAGPLYLPLAARQIALVDSERGIPLAECLLEQFSRKRLYPLTDYPKPPYQNEQRRVP